MFLYKYTCLLLFFFFQLNSNTPLTEVQSLYDKGNFEKAYSKIQKIDSEKLSQTDKALYHYLKANLYSVKNKEDKAYDSYLLSKKLYLNCDSIDKAMSINLEIAYLISAQKKNKTNYSIYIYEYLDYAQKTGNNQNL